jgi:hypothetical protein
VNQRISELAIYELQDIYPPLADESLTESALLRHSGLLKLRRIERLDIDPHRFASQSEAVGTGELDVMRKQYEQ